MYCKGKFTLRLSNETSKIYPSVVQRNVWKLQNKFPFVSYNILITFKWKYWEEKNYGRFCIPYLFDCKPRLRIFFPSFRAAFNQGRLIRLFLYAIESIDDAQSFLRYVFSTTLSFRILLSSASHAHPSQEWLWWTEGSCSGVSIITRITNKRETCYHAKVLT